MDDWEEIANKSLGATPPPPSHGSSTRRGAKSIAISTKRTLKTALSSANLPTPTPSGSPKGGTIATTIDSSFTKTMEYSAALEEKGNARAERIIELEARVDGQIVLTDTTDYAARAVAKATNKETINIKATCSFQHCPGGNSGNPLQQNELRQ